METKSNPPARHLLIVRLSAMGDVAMLPHAVRAFREAYPDVKVTIATKKLFHPFFEGLGVDFLDVDPKGRHRGVGGLFNLAEDIVATGADAVVDEHDVLRSKFIRTVLRYKGIPCSVIDKGRKEKRRFVIGRCRKPLKHTVVRYCDAIRALGFVFDDPKPLTQRLVRENPMGEKSGTWVGFAPFSAQKGKCYPLDESADLVAMLSERYDRIFIHGGGGGEEALFARRMEEKFNNVTALFDKCSLDSEIALIANLDCVVTMDSLVMHLASLTATPVVSVWGATHPDLGFLGYGASRQNAVLLGLPCQPCSVYGAKACKYGDYRCIRDITPESIVERIEKVIGR